jgi:hypothetical protein
MIILIIRDVNFLQLLHAYELEWAVLGNFEKILLPCLGIKPVKVEPKPLQLIWNNSIQFKSAYKKMEISYDISYNKDCNFANSAVTLVLNSINFT